MLPSIGWYVLRVGAVVCYHVGMVVVDSSCHQVVLVQAVVFVAAFTAAFALRILGDREINDGVVVRLFRAVLLSCSPKLPLLSVSNACRH